MRTKFINQVRIYQIVDRIKVMVKLYVFLAHNIIIRIWILEYSNQIKNDL